jgi:hypothetical protein
VLAAVAAGQAVVADPVRAVAAAAFWKYQPLEFFYKHHIPFQLVPVLLLERTLARLHG